MFVVIRTCIQTLNTMASAWRSIGQINKKLYCFTYQFYLHKKAIYYNSSLFRFCKMPRVPTYAYSSNASPIRVTPPVSSHEYSNASKFNPKSADFKCIFQQLITLLKRKIFKNSFSCGLQQRSKCLCIPEFHINAVILTNNLMVEN